MTRVYTRSEVIDYFTKAMPWPTPEELAPIVIYIKHATGCLASEGDERACECEPLFSAISHRMPGWRMSIVLSRFGSQSCTELPAIRGMQ